AQPLSSHQCHLPAPQELHVVLHLVAGRDHLATVEEHPLPCSSWVLDEESGSRLINRCGQRCQNISSGDREEDQTDNKAFTAPERVPELAKIYRIPVQIR